LGHPRVFFVFFPWLHHIGDSFPVISQFCKVYPLSLPAHESSVYSKNVISTVHDFAFCTSEFHRSYFVLLNFISSLLF